MRSRLPPVVIATLLSSCSAVPGGGEVDAGAADPCVPAPVNKSSGEAGQLMPDQDNPAAWCRGPGIWALWWKLPGTFAGGSRWHLEVHYDRGVDAEDLDFKMGRLNGGGDNVDGQTVIGSCRQAAGQDEDCVVKLPDSDTPFDAVYVMGWPANDHVRGEGFRIRVSEYVPPQSGP